MAINILCLGDLHITLKNIKEIGNYFNNLSVYISTLNKLDLIVVLGDTLDTHNKLYTTCLSLAIEYIKLLLKFAPVYILVGNHDMAIETAFLNSEHWLVCLKELEQYQKLTIVDTVLIHMHSCYKLVFCPYVSDGRFIEALNTKKGQWEDANCIFSHVTIKNAKLNSIMAQNADEWNAEYPLLISGHIHESQWIGKNMYYTGSIMQVATNESANKHVAIVEITGAKITINEVYLNVPIKKIIELDISKIDNFILLEEKNVKYSIYVNGSQDQFKSFIKGTIYKDLKLRPDILNIRFKAKLIDYKLQSANIERLKQNRNKQFIDLLKDNIDDEHDHLLTEFYNHLILGQEDITENLDDILII